MEQLKYKFFFSLLFLFGFLCLSRFIILPVQAFTDTDTGDVYTSTGRVFIDVNIEDTISILGPGEQWTTHNDDTEAWECSASYTTSYLDACSANLGGYTNTCCTNGGGCTAANGTHINLWDWNYVTGCQVTSRFEGTRCSLAYTYQTQTCGATDTCRSSPYLYAGQCSNTGCTISGVYKTCCNTNGTINGNCSGGDFIDNAIGLCYNLWYN